MRPRQAKLWRSNRGLSRTRRALRITALSWRPTDRISGLPVRSQPIGELWNPLTLVERVKDAGVAGMGGAGFPTAVKLTPDPAQNIDTLLINGTECEPYITADDTLMQCHADELVEGAQILAHVVSAGAILIGIEDNKPDAIARVAAAIERSGADIELATFPTKYPSGGEKQNHRNSDWPAGTVGGHSRRYWLGVY